MKAGTAAEIIAVFLLILTDLFLIIYITTYQTTEIPVVLGLVISIISTISTYCATRLLSFRHNLGKIDLRAIEIIINYKKNNDRSIPRAEFLSSLEIEVGPQISKTLYQDLEDRGIIRTKLDSIKIGSSPKGIKVIDTTWRAYLI